MKNYVKVYEGYQVPDGSKYFIEESAIQRAGFYKWSANELMFFSVSDCRGWMKSINSEVPSCAIELPEEQDLPSWGDAPSSTAVWIIANDSRIKADWFEHDAKEDKYLSVDGQGLWWPGDSENMEVHYQPAIIQPELQGWMPEVGVGCEVLHDKRWIKCFYIGFDINHDHVYQFASDFGIHKCYMNAFRPLKTQQEKDREALYLAVIDACTPIHKDDFNINEIVGALFYAGFTAPKAGE